MVAPVPAPKKVSRVALALVGISIVLLAGAIIRVVVDVTGALGEPVLGVPGKHEVTIDQPGMYAIFEATGSQQQNGPVTVTHNDFTTIGRGDVDVTDPNGTKVAVLPLSGFETLNTNGTIYTAAVEFRANVSGRYVVDVHDVPNGSIVVTRELGDRIAALAPWIVVIVVAGLLLVGSGIALFVSILRSGSSRRRAAGPGAPPPGWAPPGPPPGPPPGWAPPPPGRG